MSTVASIRPGDLLALASSSLRRNRLRSVLTMGAIAVSIAVMMYLISFGVGLEQLTLGSVEKSSSLLSLTVTSGSQTLQPLNAHAVEKIAKVSGIKSILPQVTLKGTVSLENQTASATIIGVDPEYLEISDSGPLKIGRFYQADEQSRMVVTSGFLRLFGLDEGHNPLVDFTVTFDKDDYSQLPALTNVSASGVVDSTAVAVYVPRKYLETVFSQAHVSLPNYENVKIKVNSLEQVQPVSDGLIAQGFKVAKVVDTIDEIRKVFFWIQLVMGALGLIALFVASIGLVNTLTISLLERTKEIAIMKALGVRRRDITRLFLVEALLMGLVGGILGIGLAYFFQQLTMVLLSLLASLAQGTVPQIFVNQWYMVAGFLLFSLVISGITGIYPARRAAKINPIEAIRYE